MNKKLIFICLALAVAAMSLPAYATVPPTVIGTWESGSTGDGWIGWSNGKTSIGASWPGTTTIGSVKYSQVALGGGSAVDVNFGTWGQCLAIQLNAAQRTAFMSSSTFSIDISIPSSASIGHTDGGYDKIYEIALNAAGPGWTGISIPDNPNRLDWWPDSPAQTKTVSVDYSTFRNAITSTGYIEIILTLQSGGGGTPYMYFDNAKLSGVPEPATIALLGLGGLALLRRKRT